MAKKVSAKKRTPAQQRATQKMLAANRKKRAAKKKASSRKKRATRTRSRSVALNRPRQRTPNVRRVNPAARTAFYAIVKQNNGPGSSYSYFNGSSFVSSGVYLKGPRSYMIELARRVAANDNDPVYVKSV